MISNILEQEDVVKGMPDAALQQEAQAPSGMLQQFLVISEIKRRTDMRKRHQNQMQEQPQGTVAEQIVMEGITGIAPQQGVGMPPQMPPQGGPQMPPQMPPQQPPPGMPPMAAAAGGIMRMANGGQARIQGLMDILAVGGLTAPDLLAQGYTMDEINAAQNELRQRMTMPVIGADSILDAGQISDPVRTPQMGAGDQYDPPFIRGFTDVISDKASDFADAVRGGIESLGIEAQKQMPNYGLVGRNDLSLPSLPMPERRSQAEMGQMFSPEEVEERLSNRPSLMSPMDFLRLRVFGGEPEPATDNAQVQGKTGVDVQPSSGVGAGVAPTDVTVQDPKGQPDALTRTISEVIETQSEGESPARASYNSAIASIDQLISDLKNKETQESPALDLSDIIDRSKSMNQANMLMQLGSGIMAGDTAKGIQRASEAGLAGTQQIANLEMKERIAKTQAGREDIRRGEQRDLDIAKLGLQREQLSLLSDKYQNELAKAASVGRNELFRTASAIVDAAMAGSTEVDPDARKQQAYALMNEFLTLYAPTFGVTSIPTLPTGGSGAGAAVDPAQFDRTGG